MEEWARQLLDRDPADPASRSGAHGSKVVPEAEQGPALTPAQIHAQIRCASSPLDPAPFVESVPALACRDKRLQDLASLEPEVRRQGGAETGRKERGGPLLAMPVPAARNALTPGHAP